MTYCKSGFDLQIIPATSELARPWYDELTTMSGEVAFEKVTGDNVETFKHTIRLCLFPVGYPKSFFRDVVAGKVSAFLLAVGARGVVGCVAWREMKGGPTGL